MTATFILSALAVIFFIAAVIRLTRAGGKLEAQSRAWLFISVIFAVVSVWLWFRE